MSSRARPPKAEGERRTKILNFWITPAEKEAIQAAAAADQRAVSDWVRIAALERARRTPNGPT